MIENAVDPEIFKPTVFPAPPRGDALLRVIFVGRFVPFKGVTMLLEAAQRFRLRHPILVTLVGDGPLRADLQQEVNARGLSDCVEFAGEQPPPAVAGLVARAHLFCLPSVRESGGAVLLEAMACARPVIAVAYGGPAELVDDAVGRALPPDGRESVVEGLVAAFEDLVRNPEAWAARGQAGLGRVLSRFTWDAKISEALALYQELLSQ
jgi:glycosyltransferase involved in cell wall biosynthesis